MASLESRGTGFRVIFRFGGRKFSRSLGTRSLRTAQAAIVRLEDNLRRVEMGLLAVPEDADLGQFLLSDGLSTVRPVAPKVITLGELLRGYLDSIPADSVEASSLNCIKIHSAHLGRILGRNLPLTTLRLPELQRYVNTRVQEKGLRGRKVCAVTVKKEVMSLSAAWTWGLNAEFIQRPFPRRGLKYPKSQEKVVFQSLAEIERRIAREKLDPTEQAGLWDSVFLSVAELEELLRVVLKRDGQSVTYCMMVLAAHTGARRSEIRRIRCEDVDLSEAILTIHEKKRVRGRLTTRRVPLSPLLIQVLTDWLARHSGTGPLFSIGSNEQGLPVTITPKCMANLFKRSLAGTRFGYLRGWHVFRHSFCSNCAAHGIDQRVLDSWVGHQTPDMSRRYRHLVPNQHRSAIASMFATANMPSASQ